jgi:hypothetical protein
VASAFDRSYVSTRATAPSPPGRPSSTHSSKPVITIPTIKLKADPPSMPRALRNLAMTSHIPIETSIRAPASSSTAQKQINGPSTQENFALERISPPSTPSSSTSAELPLAPSTASTDFNSPPPLVPLPPLVALPPALKWTGPRLIPSTDRAFFFEATRLC